MSTPWTVGRCHGRAGDLGVCCPPRGCAVGHWMDCRRIDPDRARAALRSLAREQAAGRGPSGDEAAFVSAVARRALVVTTARLRGSHTAAGGG